MRQLDEHERNDAACTLLLVSQEDTEGLKRSVVLVRRRSRANICSRRPQGSGRQSKGGRVESCAVRISE